MRCALGYEQSDHLFSWKKEREKLERKEIIFFLTTNDDPDWLSLQMKFASASNVVAPEGDAGTLASVQPSDSMRILVIILVDKIYLDKNMQPRDENEVQARLATALAHEIYGNVQFWLEADADHLPSPTNALRTTMECRVFQAGVDFLNRLLEKHHFDQQAGPSLQRLAFYQALKREKIGLNVWSKSSEATKK